MAYDIKCNFAIDTENGCHRYIQAGMVDGDGLFTGIVIDHLEGGGYGEFCIFYGENLMKHEDFEDAGTDEMIEAMDRAYPGLADAVYDTIERYAVWNDEKQRYEYTDAFIKEFFPGTVQNDTLIGSGSLAPFQVAASRF